MDCISPIALRQLVEREGGPIATLEYGIVPEHIQDPELRMLWIDLLERYKALTPTVMKIQQRLADAAP